MFLGPREAGLYPNILVAPGPCIYPEVGTSWLEGRAVPLGSSLGILLFWGALNRRRSPVFMVAKWIRISGHRSQNHWPGAGESRLGQAGTCGGILNVTGEARKTDTYGLDNDKNQHLLSTYCFLLTTLRGRYYRFKHEETGFSQSWRGR